MTRPEVEEFRPYKPTLTPRPGSIAVLNIEEQSGGSAGEPEAAGAHLDQIIAELETSLELVAAVCTEAPPAAQIVKPAPDKWSVRDVLCHLSDTERLIFRHRVDRFLKEQPSEPYFPDIDHTPWETQFQYHLQLPEAALEKFKLERAATIKLIAGLSQPSLSLKGVHQVRGAITLTDVISYCISHTHTHIAQMKRTLSEVVKES